MNPPIIDSLDSNRLKDDSDVGDLKFGHFFNFGDRMSMLFFGRWSQCKMIIDDGDQNRQNHHQHLKLDTNKFGHQYLSPSLISP